MKLVSFLIYAMLLPDKETIFSHDFLELSKNAFIEKRKKTDSNFVNSAKVGAYGTCHQQAFSQVFRVRKICENEPSVQEGIACQ